jgi:tRNA/rRNA methyltransferase
MAGTDRRNGSDLGGGPVVILVEPQLGENIGAAARAMLNCGLTELRIVRPRDGWPNEKAVASSSGATSVLDAAGLYDGTAAAVGDLNAVYATTARRRDMLKEVVTPRRAAAEILAAEAQGERVGILFGAERKGLADKIIEAPLNPGFASLNLAQAVLLVAWEWRMARLVAAGGGAQEAYIPGTEDAGGPTPRASREDLFRLFEHLEGELDAAGFLHPPHKRPTMVRNLRTILHRAQLTEPEVRTLRGVVADLSRLRHRRREEAPDVDGQDE